MANIIWAHFFGRGIVEPVDDVRISNPPSNKELLEELGKKLAGLRLRQEEADPRHLQLADLSAVRDDQQDQRAGQAYFSHGYVRRLRAEVLLDTITRVTGTEDRFPQSPPGTRAVQIHTGEISTYFLTTFGRRPARRRARAR